VNASITTATTGKSRKSPKKIEAGAMNTAPATDLDPDLNVEPGSSPRGLLEVPANLRG
jgi:hypothetical protein